MAVNTAPTINIAQVTMKSFLQIKEDIADIVNT